MNIVLAGLAGLGMWLIAGPRTDDAASKSRVSSFEERARGVLTRAGLDRVPLSMIAVTAVVLALMLAAVTFALTGVIVLALLAAIGGGALPAILITWRANQRRDATRRVWPDVVDHLVSGVRAGLALPEAISELATAGPEAVRPEFERFAETYRMTGNLSASLDELKGRLADPTADRIIETLRLAKEVGGSELATVLRGLATYLREEQAIRHEVEARQSWVMNAARLGIAAPWIVLLLLATRPEAAIAYNTVEGTVLVITGAAVSVVAFLIMRRIARLRDDRRWFA